MTKDKFLDSSSDSFTNISINSAIDNSSNSSSDNSGRHFPSIRNKRNAPAESSDDEENAAAFSKKELLSNWDHLAKENGIEHNTDKYHAVKRPRPALVVRRGQAFRMKVTFIEDFTPKVRSNVYFQIVKKGVPDPNNTNGTKFQFPMNLVQPSSASEWNGYMIGEDFSTVTIGILPPANCIVGKWRLFIGIKGEDDTVVYHKDPVTVCILFNPWCVDDQVYVEDSALRNECIFENLGLFYWGSCETTLNRHIWEYSHFEKNILRCSFYIIEKVKKLDVTKQGDAIEVCRILSTLGSAEKTPQVLVGRWDNNYSDGVSPVDWETSKQVLDKFWEKKTGVKYCQCWVFAGVVTTIARAIGVPSRSVSGVSIGRDTNANMTIDIILDSKDASIHEKSEDFSWNFHVWSECWMKRPDLQNPAYDGWQVIDGTPMIKSSNEEYSIGPAPVAAVKEGDILKPYESGYVFTEVNGDKLTWGFFGDDIPLKLVKAQRSALGVCISTKQTGEYGRQDVTSTYKYPEGSTEERETVLRALNQSEVKNLDYLEYLNNSKVKLEILLNTDPKRVVIGRAFQVIAKLNVVDESLYGKKAKLYFRVEFVVGHLSVLVFKYESAKEITIRSADVVDEFIQYDDYKGKLSNFGTFYASLLINSIEETDLEVYESKEIPLNSPQMTMTLLENPESKLELVEVYFVNTLPHEVSGYFEIYGDEAKIKTGELMVQPEKFLGYAFPVSRPAEGTKTYTVYFITANFLNMRAAFEWNGSKWSQIAV